MIGPGALEARKEAVVDIDAPSREPGREVVGQDLHVAGEDDKFGASARVTPSIARRSGKTQACEQSHQKTGQLAVKANAIHRSRRSRVASLS
jgi:hypothetical protein